MEVNLIASFFDKDRVEQVIGALRSQSAIDIRVSPGPANRLAGSWPISDGVNFSVHVFVELSRYRQAEDTIKRFGGRFVSHAAY